MAAELNSRGVRTSAVTSIVSPSLVPNILGRYPRVATSTDSARWNISYSDRLQSVNDVIVSTTSTGGGPAAEPTGGSGGPVGGTSNCSTPQPAAGWECVNGDWRPPTTTTGSGSAGSNRRVHHGAAGGRLGMCERQLASPDHDDRCWIDGFEQRMSQRCSPWPAGCASTETGNRRRRQRQETGRGAHAQPCGRGPTGCASAATGFRRCGRFFVERDQRVPDRAAGRRLGLCQRQLAAAWGRGCSDRWFDQQLYVSATRC